MVVGLSSADELKLDIGIGRLSPGEPPFGLLSANRSTAVECDELHFRCVGDFKKLQDFDDMNFDHDIGGIRRHFNRETKKLEDCFLPRCAIPEGGDS